ncbi:LysR family transcriptional regulator [Pseudoduganella sp. FT26W]|uniref:LysR family transcriptional regulator n=1 Tax=Duganella aquatilis TaxID=2666082 RepID=A0A844DC29_9BURK|nr:LysR family transcriptional regulator [Duganella aquatilis]MRW84884.1 LysR family transcriptional regulator [Duganella aquatilis]
MESISAINVFVQVAETRSLVAAGRLLGVSASAIGKRIGALEAELGARLFHRSTRSITLTSEGALFLERSRRILAEIEAAQNELSQAHQSPRGRLRVSLPLIAEPFLSALAKFKLAYPEVDLDLDFNDRQVDVIEEGFDAVIRSGEAPDSRLTARYLGAYHMLLVGAPDYFERRGVPQTSADLAQHDCIQFRYPNTGKMQMWPLRAGEIAPDFQLRPSVVCNNLEARIHFALAGVGIAYLPDFAIAAHLREGRLIRILPQCAETPGPFHIMWPSGKHLAPKFRVFIDFLHTHLFPEAVQPKARRK